MAKVSFTKFNLKKNDSVKTVTIGDQAIEVKQYLPVNDKLELIGNTINLAADDNNFVNPIKLEVFGALEILYHYTNISFTDKQKEDPVKLYDLLEGNGLIDIIVQAIPEAEYAAVIDGINNCSACIYAYKNSALGIFETITQDYSNLDLDANRIREKLADPQNMEFLKDVLTKLG